MYKKKTDRDVEPQRLPLLLPSGAPLKLQQHIFWPRVAQQCQETMPSCPTTAARPPSRALAALMG